MLLRILVVSTLLLVWPFVVVGCHIASQATSAPLKEISVLAIVSNEDATWTDSYEQDVSVDAAFRWGGEPTRKTGFWNAGRAPVLEAASYQSETTSTASDTIPHTATLPDELQNELGLLRDNLSVLTGKLELLQRDGLAIHNESTSLDRFIGLSGWAAVGALLLTWIATMYLNRFLKSQEIVLEYSRRYGEIAKSISVAQDKTEAIRCLRSFWGLQHDQFSSWRRGLIPTDTYEFWLARRLSERDNSPFSEKLFSNKPEDRPTFREGWKEVRDMFANTDFVNFMNAVILNNKDPKDMVMKHSPSKLKNTFFPFIKSKNIK